MCSLWMENCLGVDAYGSGSGSGLKRDWEGCGVKEWRDVLRHGFGNVSDSKLRI